MEIYAPPIPRRDSTGYFWERKLDNSIDPPNKARGIVSGEIANSHFFLEKVLIAKPKVTKRAVMKSKKLLESTIKFLV